MVEKRPIDIDLMISRIQAAVKPYAPAALFQLADEGYTTAFEQLIACIISIRTRDEATLPIAKRLYEVARTPQAISRLPVKEIEKLIKPSTFYERKAVQIQAIARQVDQEFGGVLPCEPEVLLSFAGVGVKCANLTLGIACGRPFISVDVHVHRVTNRWGYVSAPSPERTMLALEQKLPEKYWIEINRLLVPFGKHICTGTLPRCSTCPVLDMCRQVGVTSHR